MRKTQTVVFIVFIMLLVLLTPSCAALAIIPAEAGGGATAIPTASAAQATDTPAPSPSATPETTAEPTSAPTPQPTSTPAPVSADVHLVFAGDLMFHRSFVSSAWDGSEYNFSPVLENIEPELQQADFAIANLEAPVWDPKKSTVGDYRFAAPPKAIADFAAAGFDVLTTANNHAMDQGAKGLANTISVIRDLGLKTTGTWTNEEEKDATCMLEHDGVKIAIVAYGRHPKLYGSYDKGMGANVIDIAGMKAAVKRAKEAGADAVILCLHFGNEYTFTPTGFFQQESASAMRDAGALAIVGAHPHVLQPMELDAGGKFFVAYSLGNLLTVTVTNKRQFSALLKMTVHKDLQTGDVTLSSVTYIPTWTRKLTGADGKLHVRVYDIRKAIAACEAGTDPDLPRKYLKELTDGYAWIEDMLGKDYLDPLTE